MCLNRAYMWGTSHTPSRGFWKAPFSSVVPMRDWADARSVDPFLGHVCLYRSVFLASLSTLLPRAPDPRFTPSVSDSGPHSIFIREVPEDMSLVSGQTSATLFGDHSRRPGATPDVMISDNQTTCMYISIDICMCLYMCSICIHILVYMYRMPPVLLLGCFPGGRTSV